MTSARCQITPCRGLHILALAPSLPFFALDLETVQRTGLSQAAVIGDVTAAIWGCIPGADGVGQLLLYARTGFLESMPADFSLRVRVEIRSFLKRQKCIEVDVWRKYDGMISFLEMTGFSVVSECESRGPSFVRLRLERPKLSLAATQ